MNKEEKFNRFWSLYPRKVAKVAAQRSWKRLTNKNIDSIFKILHEHLIRWKFKEIQFIKRHQLYKKNKIYSILYFFYFFFIFLF